MKCPSRVPWSQEGHNSHPGFEWLSLGPIVSHSWHVQLTSDDQDTGEGLTIRNRIDLVFDPLEDVCVFLCLFCVCWCSLLQSFSLLGPARAARRSVFGVCRMKLASTMCASLNETGEA